MGGWVGDGWVDEEGLDGGGNAYQSRFVARKGGLVVRGMRSCQVVLKTYST